MSSNLRLGFVITRSPFLKDFGPLIARALERGHHVTIFYDPQAASGTKAYQRITVEQLAPFVGPNTDMVACGLAELVQACGETRINVLVTLDGDVGAKDRLDIVDAIRELSVQVVSIPSFFETAVRPLAYLEHFDRVYYMSAYGADLHFHTQAASQQQRRALSKNYEFISSPVFDQQRFGDFAGARERLGLPTDKKLVLFMAPVITADTPWRFGVWRRRSKLARTRSALRQGKWGYLWDIWTGPTFYDLVRAVRRFCDRNDAVLVVKSRTKHDDPEYLVQAADIYLDGRDDVYYPRFSSYELMAAADLCVSAMSLALCEAVVAGLPVLNVGLPYVDKARVPAHRVAEFDRYYHATFDQEGPSPMNFPGAVNSVSWRRAPAWLESKTFEDIPRDEAACQQYMQHYLGIGAARSSDALLDSLERLAASATKKTELQTERSL
jgi:hypothetical protein